MVRNRRMFMNNAKELMLEYTASSIRDPKKAAEMFAEDGAFEMPYLATFGIPSQYMTTRHQRPRQCTQRSACRSARWSLVSGTTTPRSHGKEKSYMTVLVKIFLVAIL